MKLDPAELCAFGTLLAEREMEAQGLWVGLQALAGRVRLYVHRGFGPEFERPEDIGRASGAGRAVRARSKLQQRFECGAVYFI